MAVTTQAVKYCSDSSLKQQSELNDSIRFNDNSVYSSSLKVRRPSTLTLLSYHGLVSFSGALIGLGAVLFFTLPAHALSATTAQTIVGTKPYLLLPDGVTKLTNTDELLGFSMPKRDGSSGTEQIDVSMADTALIPPSGMKFQDVMTFITADGSTHDLTDLTVGDEDGDANLAANTNISVFIEMKATWYDGSNKQVTNLNQTFAECGGPYTLKINAPKLIANTSYGAPNSNYYSGRSNITYTFINPKICYLQPASMYTHTGTAGVNIKYAAGYNPNVWEYSNVNLKHRGFKVDSGFPTTGFNKAVFSVIGSGIVQSKYRCSSSDDGGKIILSATGSSSVGAKCTVTYNSASRAKFTAGGTTPTINMEYNIGGSTWIPIGSYTIPVPRLWALPQGLMIYGDTNNVAVSTTFPALDRCRVVVSGSATPATTRQQAAGQNAADRAFRQTYIYRRDEFTNAPAADRTSFPEGNNQLNPVNYISRDVGTFMGEWGVLANNPYNGSGWGDNLWTSEVWYTMNLFTVTNNGDVSVSAPNSPITIPVCRG